MLEFATISTFLVSYGYLAVFAGVILGGEVFLMAAGFFAARGALSLFWIIFWATCGVILIDILWYILGRMGRNTFAKKFEKFFIRKKEKVGGWNELLTKHASKTILLVRFVYGLRAMVLILAGAVRMRFSKFLVLNIIGSLIWATIMTLLGYFFGESWNVLERYVKNGMVVFTIVVLIITIVLMLLMSLKKRVVKEIKK